MNPNSTISTSAEWPTRSRTGRGYDFPKVFKEVGFGKYHVTIKSLPLGTWPADKKMKEGQWMAAMYTYLPALSLPLLVNAAVGSILLSKRTAWAFSQEPWGWKWRRQRNCLSTVQRRSGNGLYMDTATSCEFPPTELHLAWKC